MTLKSSLLRIESLLFRTGPLSLLVLLLSGLGFRLAWLWGRARFAARVRNKGLGCVCHWSSELKHPENIILGERVIIGVNVTLGAHSTITIGSHVRISKDVVIETAGLDFTSSPPPYLHVSNPIFIDDGVWVGTRVIILGGVRIGEGSVIAAGSIVTRDVPPRTLVAGMPAKVIRQLPEFEQEDKL